MKDEIKDIGQAKTDGNKKEDSVPGENPLLNHPSDKSNTGEQFGNIVEISPEGMSRVLRIRRGELLLCLLFFFAVGFLVGCFLRR